MVNHLHEGAPRDGTGIGKIAPAILAGQINGIEGKDALNVPQAIKAQLKEYLTAKA